MSNNNELNNKSIDDLRNISKSLGLENAENYDYDELKYYIENGKIPNSFLQLENLKNLKVNRKRKIKTNYGKIFL